MAAKKPSKSEEILAEKCIRALYEKDRLNYSSKFVQGFVHNVSGRLQNLLSLTEFLISYLEPQDRIFRKNTGENAEWSDLVAKQRKKLAQLLEQVKNLTADLHEFKQLHEIEQCGTEIDINVLLSRMAKVFRSDLFFKHQVTPELRLAKNLPHIKVLGKDIVSAVFHLFQNAITALRESPKKELLIETSMQGGQILVRITDSGPGLPEGLNPDIFFDLFESRWQENDTKTAPTNYLGFGLYAARQLLLPYGFTVSLERTDEGTSALIRMPLKSNSA